MFPRAALLALSMVAVASAQQVGTLTAESHPKLQVSTCTKGGGCTTSTQSVVLDANWRWLHSTSGSNNCYTGNKWDTSICNSDTACATACALDGADYSGTYGITASGNALTLKFKTGSNVGSRVYLMDSSDKGYQPLQLINKEFTFDVDMSQLGCGLNGALYLSSMPLDGGVSTQPNNKAGAKYGTGYCDSQCPQDLKFIGGYANIDGWNGTSTNSGTGNYGACCSEMDIWEANSFAEAYTPHPCTGTAVTNVARTLCTGNACAAGGVCDPAGCDFNSWRMGNQNFLGPGSSFTVDTTKKITVVTQFISSDGTSNGDLVEIRRKYVQNGQIINNSMSNIPGMSTQFNSLTDATCQAQKTAFSDTNYFSQAGGIKQMGAALKAGMVLVLSVWDDYDVSMLWLDSDYPTTASASAAGVNRGPCSTSSGKPSDVESNQANDQVTYSNIKWGDLDSTYTGTQPPTSSAPTTTGPTTAPTSTRPTSTSPTSTPPTSTGTAGHYGQCGGTGWTGATTCASPYTCKAVSPPYYYQCQ